MNTNDEEEKKKKKGVEVEKRGRKGGWGVRGWGGGVYLLVNHACPRCSCAPAFPFAHTDR